MPSFSKGGGTRTPFGSREYLRSTQDVKKESFTVAASTVPAQTIDGVPGQKVLYPGTVMAKITSGGEAGKIGPYSTDTAGVTDGRATAANIVGLLDTFLPWQLMEHDVDVAVTYQCTAVQAWCNEATLAAPLGAPLSNATADAMRGGKRIHINFS